VFAGVASQLNASVFFCIYGLLISSRSTIEQSTSGKELYMASTVSNFCVKRASLTVVEKNLLLRRGLKVAALLNRNPRKNKKEKTESKQKQSQLSRSSKMAEAASRS